MTPPECIDPGAVTPGPIEKLAATLALTPESRGRELHRGAT